MIKSTTIFCLLVSITLLTGCGKEGNDGKAFMSFDWSSSVYAYGDDNASTPYTISKNVDYETPSGVYYYTYHYYLYDSSYYRTGSYTISINEGEKGGLFTDGVDGEDKYYSLYLSPYGASSSGVFNLLGEQKLLLDEGIVEKNTLNNLP